MTKADNHNDREDAGLNSTLTKGSKKFAARDKQSSSAARKIFFASLVFMLLAGTAAVYWMTTMPGESFVGPAKALAKDELSLSKRLNRHVRKLALEIGPRNHTFQKSYDQAVLFLQSELEKMGHKASILEYTVPGPSVPEVGASVAKNIEVVIEAAESNSTDRRYLVVGAHYDTYGDTPGANDNGSGTAVLLELARSLKTVKGSIGLRLVFFANEEPPHFARASMGSRHYAQFIQKQKIKLTGMLSIETVGYYSQQDGSQKYPFPFSVRYPNKGNFIAFVGNPMSRAFTTQCVGSFRKHAKIPSEGATIPASIRGVDWSDHRSFWAIGVPAVMVTDTAPNRYALYHKRGDLPDQLDYKEMARLTLGLEKLIEELIK